jgi:hypothetical protein
VVFFGWFCGPALLKATDSVPFVKVVKTEARNTGNNSSNAAVLQEPIDIQVGGWQALCEVGLSDPEGAPFLSAPADKGGVLH